MLWMVGAGALFFFVLGLCLGSFSNVVIYRLPKGLSVVSPSSRCPHCSVPIAWFDNIPLLSYFLLKGKCRHCAQTISWRYPLVEFLMGTLFAATFLRLGFSWTLIESLILVFGLVTVSFIDFDHYLLPNVFTFSGMGLGLVGALLNPERSFWESLFGVLLGGGFLWAIAKIYYWMRKEEGMGGGDVKLLAWIGAVLGWKAIPLVVLIASISGSLVGISIMYFQKKSLKTMIPFGPYLALGAVVALLLGEIMIFPYFHFFFPGLP